MAGRRGVKYLNVPDNRVLTWSEGSRCLPANIPALHDEPAKIRAVPVDKVPSDSRDLDPSVIRRRIDDVAGLDKNCRV